MYLGSCRIFVSTVVVYLGYSSEGDLKVPLKDREGTIFINSQLLLQGTILGGPGDLVSRLVMGLTGIILGGPGDLVSRLVMGLTGITV